MDAIPRRKLLKVVPVSVLPLAGCVGSNGNEDQNVEGEKSTTSAPSVEQYLDLRDREWVSYYLRFTVENISDTDLEFVQIDSAVYNKDTRIGTMYTNIGELTAGTKVNAEIDYTAVDVDGSLCDGTRYTLTPTVTVESDQLEHRYEYTNAQICGEDSG